MNTITLTKADLLALADKIANHEHSSISKPAACNMLAATILGPKHDWSYIKNADKDLTSQRARSAQTQTPATSIETLFPINMIDQMPDQGRASLRARIVNQTDGSVQVETDDGQVVWIEYNLGCLKVHTYNHISDSPASTYSKPTSRIEATTAEFDSEIYSGFVQRPLARKKSSPIIGYQVDNAAGENWGGRPSFEILTLDEAHADLVEAYWAGHTSYRLVPIHEGDIEEASMTRDAAHRITNL